MVVWWCGGACQHFQHQLVEAAAGSGVQGQLQLCSVRLSLNYMRTCLKTTKNVSSMYVCMYVCMYICIRMYATAPLLKVKRKHSSQKQNPAEPKGQFVPLSKSSILGQDGRAFVFSPWALTPAANLGVATGWTSPAHKETLPQLRFCQGLFFLPSLYSALAFSRPEVHTEPFPSHHTPCTAAAPWKASSPPLSTTGSRVRLPASSPCS